MSNNKTPDTKRKAVATKSTSRNKKVTAVSPIEDAFAIVHHFDFSMHALIGYANSHEEAQQMVDALHVELAVWIAAGGDKYSDIKADSMYYFHYGTKAPHFVYHGTQREVYRDEQFSEKVCPWYTLDPRKDGKYVTFEFEYLATMKKEGDFSMAAKVGLTRDIKLQKAFWHGIRTLPWSTLYYLRKIHPKHYTKLKHEDSFKEDKEDVEK